MVCFGYFGIPYFYAKSLRVLLRRKVIRRKALILTFDDGPSSTVTPAVLKLLAEYNARATFFVLGGPLAVDETVVRQIIAEGHEICSHGYHHLNHWKYSPFRCLSDIQHGWEAIDTALGEFKRTYAFRPPMGRLNMISLLYLLARRVPIIYWTLDLGDRGKSKTDFKERKHDIGQVVARIKEAGGAVVLAHDSEQNNRNRNAFTLECLRSVLIMAREIDMPVLTVSQLLNTEE